VNIRHLQKEFPAHSYTCPEIGIMAKTHFSYFGDLPVDCLPVPYSGLYNLFIMNQLGASQEGKVPH